MLDVKNSGDIHEEGQEKYQHKNPWIILDSHDIVMILIVMMHEIFSEVGRVQQTILIASDSDSYLHQIKALLKVALSHQNIVFLLYNCSCEWFEGAPLLWFGNTKQGSRGRRATP